MEEKSLNLISINFKPSSASNGFMVKSKVGSTLILLAAIL